MEHVSFVDVGRRIHLLFTHDDYAYILVVQKPTKRTGVPLPLYIDHSYENQKSVCPACGRLKGMICTELDVNRENWLRQLILHPSIRLHWLYV